MKLNYEEASDLSILLTYKALDKLKKDQEKGIFVSEQSKKEALEASLGLNARLIRGDVPAEEIGEIVQEWKDFFSKNYPERYQKKIRTIEAIAMKVKFALE